MVIYPLQAFGIGDVIFSMNLVRKIAGERKILWGVEPQFVDGLSRAYPEVAFIDYRAVNVDYTRKDDYEISGMRILPIRWSYEILGVPYTSCMQSKYDMYGLDWKEWREGAMWKMTNNLYKEVQLMGIMGVDINAKYTLINRFFGSNSQLVCPIDARGIEMCSIPGYSLFDWTFIIKRAEIIHTVSTSIIYMLELLDLKAKEIHLYPRKPIEHDFRNIQFLLENSKHNYILH